MAVMPRDSVKCSSDMFYYKTYKMGGTAKFRPLVKINQGIFCRFHLSSTNEAC